MSQQRNRQPAGTPTGGQFAEDMRGGSGGVNLGSGGASVVYEGPIVDLLEEYDLDHGNAEVVLQDGQYLISAEGPGHARTQVEVPSGASQDEIRAAVAAGLLSFDPVDEFDELTSVGGARHFMGEGPRPSEVLTDYLGARAQINSHLDSLRADPSRLLSTQEDVEDFIATTQPNQPDYEVYEQDEDEDTVTAGLMSSGNVLVTSVMVDLGHTTESDLVDELRDDAQEAYERNLAGFSVPDNMDPEEFYQALQGDAEHFRRQAEKMQKGRP